MISSDIMRGYNDVLILTILAENDSYGYEISREIMKRCNGQYEMKEPTIYAAFIRLEKNGYIESYEGEVSYGKKRTYFKLTAIGKKFLYEKREEWLITKGILENFLED